jgi:hypothetical protein
MQVPYTLPEDRSNKAMQKENGILKAFTQFEIASTH